MNKRCTNSSCRRTFSTLDFAGKCPFCGKVYPQLRRTRKGNTSGNCLVLAGMRIDFTDAIIELPLDRYKVKFIKHMRDVLKERGYRLDLKSAKLTTDYYIKHNAFPVWKWSVIPVEELTTVFCNDLSVEDYWKGGLKLADGK